VGRRFASLAVALVQRGGPDGQELLLLIATGFLGL